MIGVKRLCLPFHARAMELDAVGFIVRGVVKTQYPGPIRLTRVML